MSLLMMPNSTSCSANRSRNLVEEVVEDIWATLAREARQRHGRPRITRRDALLAFDAVKDAMKQQLRAHAGEADLAEVSRVLSRLPLSRWATLIAMITSIAGFAFFLGTLT